MKYEMENTLFEKALSEGHGIITVTYSDIKGMYGNGDNPMWPKCTFVRGQYDVVNGIFTPHSARKNGERVEIPIGAELYLADASYSSGRNSGAPYPDSIIKKMVQL